MTNKLILLQDYKERLAHTMDALTTAKQAIDRQMEYIAFEVEKVRNQILDELKHMRAQERFEEQHIALENEE